MFKTEIEKYLEPTYYLDFNNQIIKKKALELTETISADNFSEKAIKLFYFVRDQIPYKVSIKKEIYLRKNLKASKTLERGNGFCIPKSILLASLGRAVGIPTRLHFVDIENHMTSDRFRDIMGSNLFVYHAYMEFYLNGKWIEANVGFDKELCIKKGFPIIEFDGKNPGLFAHSDENGKPFVDYIKDRGISSDLPYYKILLTWAAIYGLHWSRGRKKSNK